MSTDKNVLKDLESGKFFYNQNIGELGYLALKKYLLTINS